MEKNKDRIYSDSSSPDRELNMLDDLTASLAKRVGLNQPNIIRGPANAASAINQVLDKNRSLASSIAE